MISMDDVIIALGTNIEPERHMRAAVTAIARIGALQSVSPVIQTVPVGVPHQPDYLNAAALIRTDLPPDTLNRMLKHLESQLGRRHDEPERFGPRTIDLDITLYRHRVMVSQRLHLPHPDLLTFLHVLWPVSKILPEYRHPFTGESLQTEWDRRFGCINPGPPASGAKYFIRQDVDLQELLRNATAKGFHA